MIHQISINIPDGDYCDKCVFLQDSPYSLKMHCTNPNMKFIGGIKSAFLDAEKDFKEVVYLRHKRCKETYK